MSQLPSLPNPGASDGHAAPSGAASHLPAARHKRRGHHAQAVFLDTGRHLDAKGHEHETHPGNKAVIGPDTLILGVADGHEPMTAVEHMRKHGRLPGKMHKRRNPHPNEIGKKIAALHRAGDLPNVG